MPEFMQRNCVRLTVCLTLGLVGGRCLHVWSNCGKIVGMRRTMNDRVRDLTPRHREVVRLVSLGCNLAEIAAILDLEPSTVDNHKHAAMQTLGVKKSTILTRVAIQHRISSLRDKLTPREKRKLSRRAR